ncbi:polyketide synthase [Thozetella sp. PMI_491]|nr:polyketide synthase [Thozetella sp. PMI_491]
MASIAPSSHAASAAIFSSQSSPPSTSYLAHIRSELLQNEVLAALREALLGLPTVWNSIASSRLSMSHMRQGVHQAQALADWLKTGNSDQIVSEASGLITLPLLTTIHIVQYLDHLRQSSRSHSEYLHGLKDGGVQGYCIGLLSAIIVASSANEQDLIARAADGIRLSFAIGVFGDLAQASSASSWITLALRLKQGSEDEEADLFKRFPGAYCSVISDSHTRSIIVPESQAQALIAHAERAGLRPKPVHIRGRLHHPDNSTLAKECIEWYRTGSVSSFLSGTSLQTTVRSNRSGQSLSKLPSSLDDEIIHTILTSVCDWPKVIAELASDLLRTSRRHHSLAIFGIDSSVPLAPFVQHNLTITKLDMLSATVPVAPVLRPEVVPDGLSPPLPVDAIAIVGAGCRLPGANSLEDLWDIISNGQSRLEGLRSTRADLKGSHRAGQDKTWATSREFFGNYIDDIEGFDHAFFRMSSREAKHMDPQQRLLLATAFDAMDSSGYMRHHRRKSGDVVGCFIGASYTEYLENTSAYRPSAFTATGTIRAFLSGKISHYFGWTGPSEVIDTACSASIVAIHRACQAIHLGECSMALAGGVNLITGVNNFLDLGKAGFLSPTGQCKPFDDSADGYCRADGVGLVVVKPLSKALENRDHIMGVIRATATNQGGIDAPGITVPDGTAQKALYRRVLSKSGVLAQQVSYVEAHGTGTQVGDPVEIDSIREVFGGAGRSTPLYLGSLKANLGHSETAAGVASLLKVLAMFRHRKIPSLKGFQHLNRNIPPLEPDNMYIPTSLQPWVARGTRIGCINSYGASGSNSALLCSEWREEDRPHFHQNDLQFPILLSAASVQSLQRYAEILASYIEKPANSGIWLGDLAYTLSERRKHHKIRWSCSATTLQDLAKQLRDITPGDFLETPKSTKKVVLTFSGQSQASIGLDPAVRHNCPRLEQYLQQCNDILQGLGCPDILSSLSEPGPILDPVILQCGTVALQYACARCWIDGGLPVDAVVGHSLGELTALAVSQVLSLSDTLRIVYARAQLIKEKWGPEGGTMMAIHAPLLVLQSLIKTVGTLANDDDALEIACFNSLSSHVVVGTDQSIAKAQEILQMDPKYIGVRYQRLNVTHGFHSRFMEPLLPGLIQLERTVSFGRPKIPLETCTPVQLPFSPSSSRYIANHARNAVYFADAVHRLEQRLGACAWIEAGWSSPIVAMTKKAVVNPKLHVFQPIPTLDTAIANLWREGLASTHWGFLSPDDIDLHAIWLPPYSFDSHKAWLKHVDHAAQEANIASFHQLVGRKTSRSGLTELVAYQGIVGLDNLSHAFDIHTTTERYTEIVKAHAVRGKPLCPASMYMEVAAMGLDKIGLQLRDKTLVMQDILFSRPLGCGKGLKLKLNLVQTPSPRNGSWHYAVQSASGSTFSEGDIVLATSPYPDLDLYESLTSASINMLKRDPNNEKLGKRTAYSLFAKVVAYGDLLRGISSITMAHRQALAEIRVPDAPFTTSESTVSDMLDATTLDNFIQVLGLLINCQNASESGDEIYIASAINKMVISPTRFQDVQSWTVYATYSDSDSRSITGSIFAFSETGTLAVFATKILFIRTQAAKLERVLGALHSPTSTTTAAPQPLERSQGKVLDTTMLAPYGGHEMSPGSVDLSTLSQVVPSMAAQENRSQTFHVLRQLISAYSGLPMSEIQDGVSLASMGLDSLASMELLSEIESTLGLQLSGEDLLSGDIESLAANFLSSEAPSSHGLSRAESMMMNSDHRSSIATTPSLGGDSLPSSRSSVEMGQPWSRPKDALNSRFKIETVVYKEVSGVKIPADLYIPSEIRPQPMPIAIMIHGGGHLTLSRRAVRPAQTKFLLENGIFPISIDYRLAPHINVVDGAMADVRDACLWARTDLPKIMDAIGYTVDPTKLVVLGWSTGGTLAMTTSWTLPEVGHIPPLAVLSFYCPVEYKPASPITMGQEYASRTMALSHIREILPPGPATSQAFKNVDVTKLGWLVKGDPRSEMVLALIGEENGMSLLFNDWPDSGDELPLANTRRAEAFSPLSQVRKGNYHTPTYLIFGEEDEIAPFRKAVEFSRALADHGVAYGFLPVAGAKHIFDLDLVPGSEGWKSYIEPGYRFLMEHIENGSQFSQTRL